ncbi:site-specific DNA-methyltransferase [Neobacillus sp. YIM B02564]|uniref:Methyltransferase n=2 Tax=Neobacillus paridis TaxID=2803862 RepID=A0ABS1TIH8_9BACI|nr:site-specific DNA-methyltransferase [Neobacillus paridis]
MKLLPNESVDLVLTDPPYNVSQKSNFHTMGRKGVDFGEWDKEFDLTSWIPLAVSKLKKGGSIIIFNAWRNLGTIGDELEKQGCTIKGMSQWTKTNPMPRNRDRLYVTRYECAVWAVKGKGWTFNRQRDNYEDGIFSYPVVNHKKRIHPTQKPVELLEEIIKIHSNENDIILDCFMGSASTAVASTLQNRKWVGFELEREYYELANKRLEQIQLEDDLEMYK